MRYLYKTALVVGIIILIELLKKILDRQFPLASIFHHKLLACLQLVLLIWLVFALLLQPVFFRKKKEGTFNKQWTSMFIVGCILAEAGTIFLFHHPHYIPTALRPLARDYYTLIDRTIIQYQPDCSEYNSQLFYSLKPSADFKFSNYEFQTTYTTNTAAFRDDEVSLNNPDVICTGDSFTMGWGVEQEETFAQQLEKISGKRVLNAGMSSYGTVRELKSLERLQTSPRFIVLQYCRNDFKENEDFRTSNNQLKISPQKSYDSLVALHYWTHLYYPGKHFFNLLKLQFTTKVAQFTKPRKAAADTSYKNLQREAGYFLNAIANSKINFSATTLLLLDLNDKTELNNDFINLVDSLQKTPAYTGKFGNNLITVPVADILTENDFYILDYQHLTPAGHQKVAKRLVNYIK